MRHERLAYVFGAVAAALACVFVGAWLVGSALWTFGNGDAPGFFLYGTLALAYVMAACGLAAVALAVLARVRMGAFTDDGRAALAFTAFAAALVGGLVLVARVFQLE